MYLGLPVLVVAAATHQLFHLCTALQQKQDFVHKHQALAFKYLPGLSGPVCTMQSSFRCWLLLLHLPGHVGTVSLSVVGQLQLVVTPAQEETWEATNNSTRGSHQPQGNVAYSSADDL